MAIPGTSIAITAQTAQFVGEIRKATQSLDGLKTRANALSGSLRGAFGALGVGVSAAGLALFVKSTIDGADALFDLSKKLSVSVKDLASFKLIAEQSGTSLEDVGKGIQRLTRSIGDAEGGNKQISASLKALGITARDPKEAFFQLADAVKRIQDPARRATLLNDVLGKSYADLIPLLSEGGDELRKSARASESFADAMARLAPEADKFNDEIARLKQNAAGTAASILVELVPALNKMLGEMQEGIKIAGGFWQAIRLFGSMNPFKTAGESVTALRAEIQNLQALRSDFLRGHSAADAAFYDRATASVQKKLEFAQYMQRQEALALPSANGSETRNRFAKPSPFRPSPDAGKTAADPLAGILGDTAVAKLAEYTKLLDLLYRRQLSGKLAAEQYTQALVVLNQKFFGKEIAEYNKQLEFTAETERLVAESLEKTSNELAAQAEEWQAAGRALTEDMLTPMEALSKELARLDELLARGAISWDTYARAIFSVEDKTRAAMDAGKEKIGELDEFAKSAARNMQTAFADFLFNPFEQGLAGMAQRFGQMIQRMIAEAVAADLMKALFGDLVKGGEGAGFAGAALKTIGSLFNFADGGVMSAAGSLPLNRYAAGGVATSPQLAIFGEGRMNEAFVPLPDGRSIPVKMQGGGQPSVTVNIYGNNNNAPDVRRAAAQGVREAMSVLGAGRRYA